MGLQSIRNSFGEFLRNLNQVELFLVIYLDLLMTGT